MSNTVHVEKLKNGLQLVLVPLAGVTSVSVIALTRLGSRYEDAKTAGMAHFYEHLVHDGTQKYPTNKEFAELIEQVGADSNAMTAEEYTGYYVKVESRHLSLALDAISQVMISPLLLDSEIERERGIIIEELNMREDNPQIKVYDRMMELLFVGSGLGLPGAGTKETVSSFVKKQFIDLKNTYYVAENMVLVISGDIGNDITKLVAEAENYFGLLSIGDPKGHSEFVANPAVSESIEVVKKPTDQLHLAMGWRGYSRNSEQRYAQSLLSVLLGGGFSSRLMQKIRQELSLAYSVYTDVDLFKDTGTFMVGAGLDKSRTVEAIGAIWQELRGVANNKPLLTDKELRKSKDYLRGKMALQLEDSLRLGMYYGLQQLLEGKIRLLSETMERIEDVSLENVIYAADEIFRTDRMSIVVVGDGVKEAEILKALS